MLAPGNAPDVASWLSRSALLRAVRGTEWGDFLDYVSPSFFEVVPARSLWTQGREIAANATRGGAFAELLRELDAVLAARGVAVRPRDALPGTGSTPPDRAAHPRARGQRVIELYFAQLFGSGSAALDLRGGRFAEAAPPDDEAEAELVWAPRPFYVVWDEEFIDAVRDLYGGFYRDQTERFRSGLERLGLGPAEDVFRAHFGEGDQRAVRFRTRVFQSTFHEVFVRCRDAGVSLHRNFLPLGLYLGCLYDHLEPLGEAFDVRAAFERAAGP